jgi:acyl-CoA thioesterase II
LIIVDAQVALDSEDITAGRGDLSPRDLVGLLVLEPIEVNMFRGQGLPGETRRLYGGQVAAQALAAAGCTVTGARPHSLHAYFLRPGDSGSPVLFQVDRLHDGRTFHRRRVTAIQRGEPILCLESSFTADGSDATDYHPAPRVPVPEECPEHTADVRAHGRLSPWNLFDVRRVPAGRAPLPLPSAGDLWCRFRAGETAGVTPEVMLTYLSDLTLASTTLRPTRRHPAGRPDVTAVTSLDHSMWFHRPADLSGWLLYAKTAPAIGQARGLTAGHIFNRDGTLVASVAQEALLHSR